VVAGGGGSVGAAWSGRRRRPASGAWLGATPVLTVRDSSGAAAWVELDATTVRSVMGVS
jgi:hypothetical protein